MHMWSHSSKELELIQGLINKTKRETFLEIGCYKFNMSIFFLVNSVDSPLVIANDKMDASPRRRQLIDELVRNRFKFILGDSKEPSTIQAITQALGKRKVDMLFIDGDHSGRGIENDTENYIPLVDEEGYIIWHDTIRSSREHTCPWFLQKLQKDIHLSMYFDGSSRIAYIQKKEWDRNVEGNTRPQFEKA